MLQHAREIISTVACAPCSTCSSAGGKGGTGVKERDGVGREKSGISGGWKWEEGKLKRQRRAIGELFN